MLQPVIFVHLCQMLHPWLGYVYFNFAHCKGENSGCACSHDCGWIKPQPTHFFDCTHFLTQVVNISLLQAWLLSWNLTFYSNIYIINNIIAKVFVYIVKACAHYERKLAVCISAWFDASCYFSNTTSSSIPTPAYMVIYCTYLHMWYIASWICTYLITTCCQAAYFHGDIE